MLESYHDEMKALIEAGSFDEQALLSLRAKYRDTFDQLALIKAKSRYDFLQMLTAEQKAKMAEFVEKRKAKGEHDHPPRPEF